MQRATSIIISTNSCAVPYCTIVITANSADDDERKKTEINANGKRFNFQFPKTKCTKQLSNMEQVEEEEKAAEATKMWQFDRVDERIGCLMGTCVVTAQCTNKSTCAGCIALPCYCKQRIKTELDSKARRLMQTHIDREWKSCSIVIFWRGVDSRTNKAQTANRFLSSRIYLPNSQIYIWFIYLAK